MSVTKLDSNSPARRDRVALLSAAFTDPRIIATAAQLDVSAVLQHLGLAMRHIWPPFLLAASVQRVASITISSTITASVCVGESRRNRCVDRVLYSCGVPYYVVRVEKDGGYGVRRVRQAYDVFPQRCKEGSERPRLD